jgi:hypothetical protein
MDRYAGSSETAIDMKALAAEDHLILASYFDEPKGLGASDEDNSSAETNNANPGVRDGHSG